MSNEKTQFTPEDVGRSFYTEKEGITAKLVVWDDSDETNLPCKFIFSNGGYSWAYKSGVTYGMNYEPNVFPSRPVEDSKPDYNDEIEALAREVFLRGFSAVNHPEHKEVMLDVVAEFSFKVAEALTVLTVMDA